MPYITPELLRAAVALAGVRRREFCEFVDMPLPTFDSYTSEARPMPPDVQVRLIRALKKLGVETIPPRREGDGRHWGALVLRSRRRLPRR